jgi:ribosomal-protein-alanine N-acetyltransferase
METRDAASGNPERNGRGWAIHRATEAELAQIVLLERETVTAPHWAYRDYADLLRADPAASIRRGLLVATEGRMVLGFAVGSAFGSGCEVECELESVVVRDDMRRQGLGSALCRAVMDWARIEGAGSIALEVRASSGGALRLYGGMGFVATGRRPSYYPNPTEDAIVMHCTLNAGNSRYGGGSLHKLDDTQSALFQES